MSANELTPMNQQEVKAYLVWNKGSQTITKIVNVAKTATAEQKAQLVAHAKNQMDAAQKAYDDEVKFRPSYAPGPTRSEDGKKALLKDAIDFYRFCLSI